MPRIDNFHYADGKPSPLSNFYPSPIGWIDATYPTVEHYFQAMKTDDLAQRAAIAACQTAGEAKRMGRRATLKPDWEARKLGVMRNALELKFSFDNHPVLAQWLLDTGDAHLIEGNTWGDTFWGVCNGSGLNWLGTLLMARRAELRASLS